MGLAGTTSDGLERESLSTGDIEETGLEWEGYRMGFVHQLGKACIRASTDGCLSSEEEDDIHAAMEVKPFSIAMRTEQTFMQMDMKMLAFILYRDLNEKPKEWYEALLYPGMVTIYNIDILWKPATGTSSLLCWLILIELDSND